MEITPIYQAFNLRNTALRNDMITYLSEAFGGEVDLEDHNLTGQRGDMYFKIVAITKRGYAHPVVLWHLDDGTDTARTNELSKMKTNELLMMVKAVEAIQIDKRQKLS